MTDLIERVKCSVIITLNNGTEIDISLSTVGEKTNLTNWVFAILSIFLLTLQVKYQLKVWIYCQN